MKRIALLAVLSLELLMVWMLPTQATDHPVWGDFAYIVLEDGTAEIYEYLGSASVVEIPQSIAGYRITSIGYGAFGKKSPVQVTVPEGVTNISYSAFSSMPNLTTLNLPSTWQTAHSYYYDGWICGNCPNLTRIVLPEGLTVIPEKAFAHVDNLQYVYIPSTVIEIGEYAFNGCENLVKVEFAPDSCLKTIGMLAFEECMSLTSIALPEGLEEIHESAFRKCAALTTVRLPDSLRSMGYGVFNSCSQLTTLRYPMNLEDCSYAFSGAVITGITVPEGVTHLPDGVFGGMKKLAQVNLPQTLTVVGQNAFSGCEALTAITLPDSVFDIGSGAFYGCKNLVQINFPISWRESTETGWPTNDIFEDCESLTEIIIPEGATTLLYSAFDGADNLALVQMPTTLTEIDDNPFGFYPENITISVVRGSYQEQWATEHSFPVVYHEGPVVSFTSTAATSTVVQMQDIGSSNGMRMLLLSTGGKLSYTVSDGKVYASAHELAALRGCVYMQESQTFTNSCGVIYGTMTETEIIETDVGNHLVDLRQAAQLLGLTLTYREDGRAVVRSSQTASELINDVQNVYLNADYRKFETFIGPYYWVEYYGTELVGGLLTFDWIGSAFNKLTGNYDQSKYNEAFNKIILHTGSYEQAMKSYKDIESAIADPLNMLNWFEDAVNDEDGELFNLMKKLGDSDNDAAAKVRQWGNIFYEAVYSDPVTSEIMDMADLWEGITDVQLDKYAKEVFTLLNYCSAVAHADEMTILGMRSVFLNSDNHYMRNSAQRIEDIYADRVTGGLKAGATDWAVEHMNKQVDEWASKGLEYLTGDKSWETATDIIKTVWGFVDDHITHSSDYVDQVALNTVLMQMQLEEYGHLCSFDPVTVSGEALKEFHAVAVLYLRTLLAIYDTGYFDYEDNNAQVVSNAQNDLRMLLQYSSDEYTVAVNNDEFLQQLIMREQGEVIEFVRVDTEAQMHAASLEEYASSQTYPYAVIDIPMDWYSATEYCEQLGGHLVTITSQFEQDLVASYITLNGTMDLYWMGMHDNDTTDGWQWVTGEPVDYTNWLSEVPVGRTELLGEIYAGAPNVIEYKWSGCGGWWGDFEIIGDSNTLPHGFICEWDSETERPTDPSIVGAQLSIGDYVKFGNDHTWQIINLEGDVATLFYGGCFQGVFDASLHLETHALNLMRYNTYGSATWEYSDVRQWLNSRETTDKAIDVAFDYSGLAQGMSAMGMSAIIQSESGSYAFADEPGFLCRDNFTDLEYWLLEPTENISIVPYTQIPGDVVSASSFEKFKADMNLVYSDKVGQTSTVDRMFLLSGREIKEYLLDNNLSPFVFTSGKTYPAYWLRDSVYSSLAGYYFYYGSHMLTVDGNGARAAQADSKAYIRPACNINLSYVTALYGTGTVEDPYTFEIDSSVSNRSFPAIGIPEGATGQSAPIDDPTTKPTPAVDPVVASTPQPNTAFEAAFTHTANKIDKALCLQSAYAAEKVYDPNEIVNFLSDLGFDKGSIEQQDYISSVPHSVAITMAQRVVNDENGTPVTLYALLIRGTEGLPEWISDFDIGEGDVALGFDKASTRVLKHFAQYVKNHPPLEGGFEDGKYKIWISGHSRGAAVGNLLAGKYLPQYLNAENTYAYGFATPLVDKHATICRNIFNFNIAGDLVPYVPFSEWGFQRYGLTVYNTESEIEGIKVNTEANVRLLISFILDNVKSQKDYVSRTKEFLQIVEDHPVSQEVDLEFMFKGIISSCATFGTSLELLFKIEMNEDIEFLVNYFSPESLPNGFLYNYDDIEATISYAGITHSMDTYLLWIEKLCPIEE